LTVPTASVEAVRRVVVAMVVAAVAMASRTRT
jgi:hypothetical protein